ARFSLQGRFHQPLLSRHASDLQTWDGEVTPLFRKSTSPHAALPGFVLGDALQTGQGWLRAWAQVRQGRVVAQTVDIDMQALRWQANETAPAVLLQHVQGRLHHQAWLEGLGQDLRSQDLALRFEEGEEWNLGNSRVAWRDEGEQVADAGELQLQGFSLEMLARVAQRLPFGERWQARLALAQPKGQVKQLDVRWFLAHSDAPQFNLKTEVAGLSLQSSSSAAKPDPALWWPGLQSSQLSLEVSEHGGKAKWQQSGGRLEMGGIWETNQMAVKEASADVSWVKKDSQWAVTVHQAHLENPDLQAQAKGSWLSGASEQDMGVLDMQAKVARLEVTTLHRYLPRAMDEQAATIYAMLCWRVVSAKPLLSLKAPWTAFRSAATTRACSPSKRRFKA
ncbi:MAG: hypothetical protein EBQ68_03440, partial [Betaproteobacteria bacterium]|nr:hypothetical protein [Betaproteobacteria bacterium]